MRNALTSLPWVEDATIHADRSTKTVRFGINDKSQFSMSKIRSVLGSRYSKGLELVEGPP